VFGKKTTGAGNDIERATELARAMVTEWGMSEEFGPLNFAGNKQEVFLGRDFTSSERCSEDTARRIDAEIRRIVLEEYERAKRLLSENRPGLESVAAALLDYETLDGEDIEKLLRGEKLTRALPTAGKRPDTKDEGAESKKRPSLIPPVPAHEPEPA
jgi:cell division protease FtsH